MEFSKTPPLALIKATRAPDESRASACSRNHHTPFRSKPQRPGALSKTATARPTCSTCIVLLVVGGFTEMYWVQAIRKM
ncbi:uncharacterized [Tachysurus ichikawai]